MTDYLAFNQNRWNRVAKKRGNPYTIPLTHDELIQAKHQPLAVALTVGKVFRLPGLKRHRGGSFWG